MHCNTHTATHTATYTATHILQHTLQHTQTYIQILSGHIYSNSKFFWIYDTYLQIPSHMYIPRIWNLDMWPLFLHCRTNEWNIRLFFFLHNHRASAIKLILYTSSKRQNSAILCTSVMSQMFYEWRCTYLIYSPTLSRTHPPNYSRTHLHDRHASRRSACRSVRWSRSSLLTGLPSLSGSKKWCLSVCIYMFIYIVRLHMYVCVCTFDVYACIYGYYTCI